MSISKQQSHWKRNLGITVTIILTIVVISSIAYYSYCAVQYERLMNPSIVKLILDPVSYMNEFNSFREQCRVFYNFGDPNLVRTVDQIMSGFEQYKVSDVNNDVQELDTQIDTVVTDFVNSPEVEKFNDDMRELDTTIDTAVTNYDNSELKQDIDSGIMDFSNGMNQLLTGSDPNDYIKWSDEFLEAQRLGTN